MCLAGATTPDAFLPISGEPVRTNGRAGPGATADRVAWGGLPPVDYPGMKHRWRLTAVQTAGDLSLRFVHRHLTRNVLFHRDLPPLVIDLTPY